MHATTDATPYSIPVEPGRWRAFGLALLMHGLLVALLWITVHWQSSTPTTIEAEVWSPITEQAAPVAPPPAPEPEPEPEVAPPPKPVEVPLPDPEIALKAEKKKKEELRRQEEEDRRLLERQKKEREKKEQEKKDAEKKKADEEKKKKDKAEQAKLDKMRAQELSRFAAQAGSGSPTSTGTAAKSTGSTDAGYGGRIAAKIKNNTVFLVPEGLPGNPAVEYTVDLFPDGSIRRPIKKTQSSGVPGFDEAVLAAIEKSQPFPPDKTGNVPGTINIRHRPKD